MLVLKRKHNDTVILTIPPSTKTRTVAVTVTEFRQHWSHDPMWCKLGFDAPREIVIARAELIHGYKQQEAASE